MALLLPPSVEMVDSLPSELLEVVSQLWKGELDGSEALPIMLNLKKQAKRVELAMIGSVANV